MKDRREERKIGVKKVSVHITSGDEMDHKTSGNF